ncbi:hypothetical protein N665_0116s0040 [Sinapis alba]|nr:hypothetical protein N665_0116s0040 [Sinapis alba]
MQINLPPLSQHSREAKHDLATALNRRIRPLSDGKPEIIEAKKWWRSQTDSKRRGRTEILRRGGDRRLEMSRRPPDRRARDEAARLNGDDSVCT